MRPDPDIKVLIIDDSAANRRAISHILENAPGIKVVDRAADGEEGLKKAIALQPDVITLDLEMPKLDGFTFLRLLMSRRPTPVIVISSYGHPSDVFKALQLGAFDFVAKPAQSGRESLNLVRSELIEKVRSARFARREEPPEPPRPAVRAKPARAREPVKTEPERPLVVAVGASTGGPPAVQKLLESLAGLPVCVLVAQHMPARFTDAFADRLDHALAFQVSEAKSGDLVAPGRVFIAPGGEQLEVLERSGEWVLSVKPALPADKHAPSVDRLFASVAKTVGGEAFGVVLTGMGNDGADGVKALAKVGAQLWAEAESSAIVNGMPAAAIATGVVGHVHALDDLGPSLCRALEAVRDSRAASRFAGPGT